jgi:TldD protein
LIFGQQVLYAHSSDDSEIAIIKLLENLCVGRSLVGDLKGKLLEKQEVNSIYPVKFNPRNVDLRDKLEFLTLMDSLCREKSSKITQVGASIFDVTSQIQIYNSEGLDVSDERIRSRLSLSVTAGDGTDKVSAREAPGMSKGFEYIQNYNYAELCETVSARSLRMLESGYVKGGQMPVIIGNGFGGVIFHEACGHPLESESVRRQASPFCDKMGEQIAHQKVTAIDDGTIASSWGRLILMMKECHLKKQF